MTLKNWDEFLEHPKSPSIAMAHNNWDAKLALAVLEVRRGDRILVMDRICESCYRDIKTIGVMNAPTKHCFCYRYRESLPTNRVHLKSTFRQVRRPDPLVLKVIEEEAWDWSTFFQQARSDRAR